MNIMMKDSLNSQIDKYYLGENVALEKLNDFDHYIMEKRKTFMGYPCNGVFKLEKFFKWWEQSVISKSPLNDVGNPNSDPSYTLNARPYETTVLQFFADLFSLENYWGYITSGGTQGNEQGLYMGRQALTKFGKPILYFSEEAHYSIASLGKILDLECRIIHSKIDGEMDYEDLSKKLDAERPALFSLSIGTTFKGGIDRIEIIDNIVKNKGVKNVFYHADAALFGGYLPFFDDPTKPNLNFEKFPYDSIAVSGHKFFGSPTPLGIFLIRNKYIQALVPDYIEYIHTQNITIPCSRSALSTLIFWWTITTTPQEEFAKQAKTIIENAQYLYQQLQKRQYPSWLNAYSNTVYFKAPSSLLCKHWTLSLFTCPKLGPLAHAIIMQHVDKKMIDEFLQELDKEIVSKKV